VDDQRVKGPHDEIGSAQIVGLLNLPGTALRRNNDHGDFLDPALLIHDGQYLVAVLARHDNIQQYGRELHHMFLDHFNGLNSVRRLEDPILFAQNIRQNGAINLGIVHNQYVLLLRMILKHNESILFVIYLRVIRKLGYTFCIKNQLYYKIKQT